MDGFEKLEQMPGIKLVPLFIKNAVVNLFNTLEAEKVTLTISNMGRIPLQKELQPYIKGFTAFCSSTTAFTTVCSYGCLLYTSPSPRDLSTSRMPSSA